MADALKHAERRDAQNNIETLPIILTLGDCLKLSLQVRGGLLNQRYGLSCHFWGEMREQFITFGVQAD